jgi:hypothetical protein
MLLIYSKEPDSLTVTGFKMIALGEYLVSVKNPISESFEMGFFFVL